MKPYDKEVIGNGYIYHRPDCHTLKKANPSNLIKIKSWEGAAVAEGMSPCGVCKPTFSKILDEKVIGNVYTYHQPDCYILGNINRSRLTIFQSWEGAVAEGMTPCGVCKPTFFTMKDEEVIGGMYVYHRPLCPYLIHVHPSFLKRYPSWEKAEDQYKRPCKFCRPSIFHTKETKSSTDVPIMESSLPIADATQETTTANTIPTKEPAPSTKISLGVDQPSGPLQGNLHLNIPENVRGWSYRRIFADYMQGARKITVRDPYIRLFHQVRNLMEFLQMIHDIVPEGDRVEVHLITQSDPDTCEKQEEFLSKITESFTGSRVSFSWKLNQNFHARSVETDTGWRILLDRGLDMFQKYEGGALSLEAHDQETRMMRGSEITYLKQ